MKAIVCEMCGSNDVVKQDGVYVCQHCETKYSTEEAKKLFIEVNGTVKIDTTDEFNNLIKLADRAYEEQDFKTAQSYYDKILRSTPDDVRAMLRSACCRAYSCVVRDIPESMQTVCARSISAINVIAETYEEKDKINGYKTVIKDFCAAEVFLSRATFGYIEQNLASGDINLINRSNKMYDDSFTKLIVKFSTEIDNKDIEFELWDNYKLPFNSFAPQYQKAIAAMEKLNPSKTQEIIQQQKEKDAARKSSSGGCYVATAVYGSYDCPQVWTLRRFRDYTLAETWYGRAFIHTYYAISPTLVKWFGKTKWFKNMWKPTLDRMVNDLNKKGVDNTPYNDREW